MKEPDFEERLRQQPIRSVPAGWRKDILAAATQQPSATFGLWLRQLFWPHPTAWAALAAAWMLILGLDFFSSEADQAPQQAASYDTPAQRLVLAEQRRLWLELTAPVPADGEAAIFPPRRPEETRPRSEQIPTNQAV